MQGIPRQLRLKLMSLINPVMLVNPNRLWWMLKLIAVTSQSIHLMTSRDHTSVLCVTNGLHGETIWMFTNEYTEERSRFSVLCVTNGLHAEEVWMFTNEYTDERSRFSVPCVINDLHKLEVWMFTNEVTEEKSHFIVLCVIKGLHGDNMWLFTNVYTVQMTSIHVVSVRNVSHFRAASCSIWIFMMVNTSAQNVANVIKVAVHWQYTGEVIQERNRLNVLFVANDLHSQVALWSCESPQNSQWRETIQVSSVWQGV